ncbi:MAG: SDR family NAD(P)-dependent oxidoreductase [Pseudomonadales bacterium]|nr:SDR family NAD(P)-dependent oxidoreductase [Pseudomonadales bacterium]
MFTGQGAQYVGMGKDLYEYFLVFQEALDKVALIMSPALERPLLSVLWGDNQHLLNETQYTQPAIFALQYALSQLWTHLGIQASTVIGHSIGEYAAAVYAGVMSLEDAAHLICARGKLMATKCLGGAMAAVFANESVVSEALEMVDSTIDIAAINGPNNCVISGESAAVAQAMALLSDMSIKTTQLPVSHAFHSLMMQPMLEVFSEEVSKVTLKPARIRFISSKTGKLENKLIRDAQYWVEHVREPVRFLDAAAHLSLQSLGQCLEVGPGANLVKLAPLCAQSGSDCKYHYSLDRDRSELEHLMGILQAMHVEGLDVNWSNLFNQHREGNKHYKKVQLPSYPYQKQSYWLDKIRMGNYSGNKQGVEHKLRYVLDWVSQTLDIKDIDHDKLKGEGASAIVIGAPAAALSQLKEVIPTTYLSEDVEEWELLQLLKYSARQAIDTDKKVLLLLSAPADLSQEKSLQTISALLTLVKAIEQFESSERPFSCWCVTENVYGPTDINLNAYSVVGFAKSVALELGENWGGIVDFSDVIDQEISHNQLWQEISNDNAEDVVRYLGQSRSVLRLKPQATFDSQGMGELNNEASYLITGGMGGLGLQVLNTLANAGAKHFVLVSRRSNLENCSDVVRDQIESLIQSYGVSVQIVNLDVSDRDSLISLVESIQKGDHPLRGVVHAAGVSDIKLTKEMTLKDYQAVSDVKTLGGLNLHHATEHLTLDFFSVFSSIASVWGSGGMAHYSAANHFLDGLVAYRRANNLPANGFNWGPWGEVGMAAGDAVEETQKRGLRLLEPDTAIALMEHYWHVDEASIIVDVDWQQFRSIMELRKDHPLFGQLGKALTTTKVTGEKSAFLKSLYSLSVEERQSKIQEHLQVMLNRIIGKSESETIDPELPLMDLGIDSIMALEIKKQLEAETGETVKATLIFDYPTINKISAHFAHTLFDEEPEHQAIQGSQISREPIAIVGIGSRLPKAPNGPGDFWRLLKNGESGIDDKPDQRWDIDTYLDTNPDIPGKSYTFSAGLIDDIEGFDGKLFGIAPRELESMEPQQRLALEAAWGALENAGCKPKDIAGSKTGVFMGVGANEYIRSCADSAREEDIMFIPTGNALNVIAGRVAFTLGLNGPCMAVDTACSSSAVAIHLASQSLQNGECDMALAGGVNAMVMPETFIALSKAHMLSKDGRCKTFDANADGYVRGEGVGMLALKRLSDALAEGDHIFAVIKGSAINQDGRSSSLTAPNGPSQEAVIQAALANAGLSYNDVDWVEAHGTATPLGDPIEVQSLESVYCKDRSSENPLILSSVKTNIGHLESAAGVSSVIKAALSLHHEEIPPHINYQDFNPHISVDKDRFLIPTESMPWGKQERTRRVGVSSFGFSGTNVHLILEEAPTNTVVKETESNDRESHILLLSAKTEQGLQNMADQYSDFLLSDNLNAEPTRFADVAYTTNNTRQLFEHRLAVVASDSKTAAEKLKKNAQGMKVVSAYQGYVDGKHLDQAWLFTGQGSQYQGMAQKLYETNPIFKLAFDDCDLIFQQHSSTSLKDVFWGVDSSLINNTQFTQPAIFALQYALAMYLRSLDLKPKYLLGHSVGEYAAAVIAGIFTLEDAIALISARGRLMVDQCKAGDMAAILASSDSVEELICGIDSVQVAAINGNNNAVISGEPHGIAKVIERADAKGIEAKKLVVSHAFHSQMMAPMLADFKAEAERIQYQAAEIDIVSTLTGELNQGEMSTPDYWVNHVQQPVNFLGAIQTLSEASPRIFLEVGPSSTLIGLTKPIVDGDHATLLHCLRIKQDSVKHINQTLAQMSVLGVDIDWLAFDSAYPRHKVMVPSYSFDRKRFWLGDANKGSVSTSTSVGEVFNNLLTKIHSPMSKDFFFENSFGIEAPFYLEDHRLYEVVVAPGAFHLANVLLSAREVYGETPVMLDDVVFPAPFILSEGEKRRLHYGFVYQDDSNDEKRHYKIQGLSREEASVGDDWTLHASLEIENCDVASELQVLTTEDIEQIQGRATHVLKGDKFYEEMDKIGYQLGPQFRWISEFWRKPGETLTRLRLPESALEQGDYLIHPGLLDSCFQSSALATMHEGFDAAQVESIYIPFALEKFKFFAKPSSELWCHVKIKNPPANDNFDVESYSHTIQVYDEKGRILIDLDTLHSKRAPKSALLKALNKDPLANHYQVLWKSQARVNGTSEKASPPKGSYVILGDGGELHHQVCSELEDVNQISSALWVCDYSKQAVLAEKTLVDEQSVRINPDNLQHWNQAFELVGGLKDISGIIYVAPSTQIEDDLLDTQRKQFSPVLALIKSAQLLNSTNVPRLWCVTQRAVVAQSSDTNLNVNQSSLVGFGKVLDMEHSEFNAVMIDVDSESFKRSARNIVSEIAEKGDEKQIAYRRGSRFVARMSRVHETLGMSKPTAPYRLTIEKKGTFDELKFEHFVPRQLGSTQVAVKVLSAGLNFRDVMGVLDVYPGEPGPLGGECIGEVTALGDDVTDFEIGDRVMVPLTESCMSTNTVSEQLLTCRVPKNLSINQASTIPVVYCTALHGLKNIAKLKAGERVLIHAGAGGVGLAAIYIAKHIGAEVYATASEKKRDYLLKIGVDHVFDSRTLEFADQIRELTQGEGVDVVLNSLAGEFITKSMELLSEGGRFIEIGKADIWSPDRVRAFRDDIYYEAFDLVMVTFNDPLALRSLMDEIVANVEAGHYQPLPYTVFSHKHAVDAFRYMAQGKHIGKILINPDEEPVRIHSDRSYLITGATGGLGLLFAQWLADQGAGELVLMARRDPRNVNEEAVKRIEAKGTRVTVIQGDVGDQSQVASAIETIEERCLPLAGVLHAAGVLADAFITNLDFAQFEKVMQPKLAAAWYLHQSTRHLPLDMFVLFSSLSSLLGAPGQGNYAAANAFLDGLAQSRRAQGLPAIAINWGPWAEVGMAATEQVSANAKASGVNHILPQEGLENFARILEQNPVKQGVMDIDWATLINMTGTIPSFLSELEVKADSGMDSALQEMAAKFREQLEDAPIDERTTLLIEKICEQIQRVMGLEESETINPNQPLQELGLDSLMAVELRNILCALIGKQLPATLMFKYPTVASLSTFLIDDMFAEEIKATDGEGDSLSDITSKESQHSDSSDIDHDVDAATDEELEALLQAELSDEND